MIKQMLKNTRLQQNSVNCSIVIGTKAQLIKMLPIIKILESRGVDYRYIDTGQHALLTKKIRQQFGLKDPDYSFVLPEKNINTTSSGLLWILKIIWKSLVDRNRIFKFGRGRLCLVHGDTVSTLLGLVMGKIARQKIVHVEAGFRSQKLLKPFPEEIVRRIVDRFSDINFTFNDGGEIALKKERNKKININVGENTLVDIVRIACKNKSKIDLVKNYVLVSIHRYETILSRSRMRFVVDVLNRLSLNYNVVWGLHEPTREALLKFGLYDELLNNKKIFLQGLFDYFDFISVINNSLFLMTDGGGPQDETKYLGVPCLVVRTENEKPGYKNVFQCGFEMDKVEEFLEDVNKYRVLFKSQKFSPSERIVEILLQNA